MKSHPAGLCFVIPTYNEAPNILPLLRRLATLYPDADTAFLVVDDRSPDGTARLAREFAAGDPRVQVLEGPRRGLGRAYVRGMAHALDVIGAAVVVQIDADFSHDPADVRRLLARLDRGADVAIGSRYVSGGSLDPRWSAGRRALSRWGNRCARRIAGVRGIRDCTAGFKAIRAQALRAARPREIRARGHAFQVVLLHRLLRSGARVVEEPIHFRDRDRGHTKLGAGGMVEFLYSMGRLHVANHRTLVKYSLTGLVGALVNLGSFQLLIGFGLDKYLASPIAIELSIVSNFLINNSWTFAERVMTSRKLVRGLVFNLAALAALALSYATFVALTVPFPHASPVLLQACGILPAAVLNYLVNSRWTFRETAPPLCGQARGRTRPPATAGRQSGC